MSSLQETPRTRLTRKRERGSHDRELVDSILDAAWLCHVAFVDQGSPVVLPLTYVRLDSALYVHGPSRGRLLCRLAGGGSACVNVALVDGLVLARAQLHHSMNYRSVVAFGEFRPVVESAAKRRVLSALIDRLAPGRSAASRPPSAAELDATAVLRFELTEASAKCRSGPPNDTERDRELPHWAGVIPLSLEAGDPIPAP